MFLRLVPILDLCDPSTWLQTYQGKSEITDNDHHGRGPCVIKSVSVIMDLATNEFVNTARAQRPRSADVLLDSAIQWQLLNACVQRTELQHMRLWMRRWSTHLRLLTCVYSIMKLFRCLRPARRATLAPLTALHYSRAGASALFVDPLRPDGAVPTWIRTRQTPQTRGHAQEVCPDGPPNCSRSSW